MRDADDGLALDCDDVTGESSKSDEFSRLRNERVTLKKANLIKLTIQVDHISHSYFDLAKKCKLCSPILILNQSDKLVFMCRIKHYMLCVLTC